MNMRRSALAMASLLASCRSEAPPDATAASTGDGVALTEGADEDGSAGDESPDPTDTRLDIGTAPLPGGVDCGDGTDLGDDETFHHIWIANSSQGTVSKIDTQTGEELARYFTGPGGDDPSRTSVGLDGDVVVANRGGGIVKIFAETTDCLDDAGATRTSSGPDDVLPWGDDTCVAWHVALPGAGGEPLNHQGARPVAWDAGPDLCFTGDERVWVGWFDRAADVGHFRRLDGRTGTTLDEVAIEDWSGAGEAKLWGPYGGATDAQGAFWALGWGGPLVRIDPESLDVDRYEAPGGSFPYGIALDGRGEPWLAGLRGELLHFDPAAETFELVVERLPGTADVGGALARQFRGVHVDGEGRAWIAANAPCGLIQVDIDDGTVIDDIALPGCVEPVGVAVDHDAMVWLPDRGAGLAFRVNPIDYTVDVTTGLVDPYTYSDMTGAGLKLVVYGPEK